MRILGIDPGTGTIGFGLIRYDSREAKLVDAGVIKTTIGEETPRRLLQLFHDMQQLVTQLKPDVAAVEKLFFAQNVTTAMQVSQARGVILVALAEAGVPLYEYTPLQIKMAMTGYGRASKAQIQELVRVQLSLKRRPRPDDAADALACALTHAAAGRMNHLGKGV